MAISADVGLSLVRTIIPEKNLGGLLGGQSKLNHLSEEHVLFRELRTRLPTSLFQTFGYLLFYTF